MLTKGLTILLSTGAFQTIPGLWSHLSDLLRWSTLVPDLVVALWKIALSESRRADPRPVHLAGSLLDAVLLYRGLSPTLGTAFNGCRLPPSIVAHAFS